MTSNTQANLFTRVPRSIEKTWSRRIVDTETLSPVFDSQEHVLSPVESVSLSIIFTEKACEEPIVLTEIDDKIDDRMLFIQQQKRLYSNLETAIQSAITNYTGELAEIARKRGLQTVEVPSKRSTTYAMANRPSDSPSDPNRLDNRREQHFDPGYHSEPAVEPRVRTITPSDLIAPNDSASVRNGNKPSHPGLNVDQLATLITNVLKSEKFARDESQSKRGHRRTRSKARSVMTYIAGS